MSLHKDISAEIKEAMKAKDAVRLTTIRGLVTAFVNELVAKGKKPDGELGDEEALVVIKRAVKQRKDSIEQYQKGGRQDLADAESAELTILEKFMPAQMSPDAIKPLAEAKKKELGITEKKDAGKLMASLMKDLRGQADGGDVKAVVDALFS